MTHKYTIVLIDEEGRGAVNVRVPAMPGVFTWGANEAEAIESAREAIALHLESYRERGEPYPVDHRPRATLGSATRVVLTRVEIEDPAPAPVAR
jgi:predicted RNase H-like HicB family nuclease